jgi:hypothetical protein
VTRPISRTDGHEAIALSQGDWLSLAGVSGILAVLVAFDSEFVDACAPSGVVPVCERRSGAMATTPSAVTQ